MSQLEDESNRIAVQMLIQKLPNAAVKFFLKAYPVISTERLASCTRMAEAYGCTPQGASKHIEVLERFEYFERVHYRAWTLNKRKITDVISEGEYL